MRWFWNLLKAAAVGWWEDRAMSLGAAIAFFAIVSLAPVLLAAMKAHKPGHIPDGQGGKEDVGDRVQPVANALVLRLKEITCSGK